MPRRLLRDESPFGGISFEEYQAFVRSIRADFKSQSITEGDTLTLTHDDARGLFERSITIDQGSLWGRLLALKGPLTAPIFSEKRELANVAKVRFTPFGFALVKSVERNAKGTGLLDHTADAANFREALLAELIARLGTVNDSGKRIIADIPLPGLRWWLGITGKYPELKNIRMAIINRQESPLKIEECADNMGAGYVRLMCLPPVDSGDPSLLVSPKNQHARELAKKSGEPLAAAIALLEDAKFLRPELSEAQAVEAALTSNPD